MGRTSWQSAWPMMETFLWRNLNLPGPHTVKKWKKTPFVSTEWGTTKYGQYGLNKRTDRTKTDTERSQPLGTVPQLWKTSGIIQMLNTQEFSSYSSTSNWIKTLDPVAQVPFLFSLYNAESALNSTMIKSRIFPEDSHCLHHHQWGWQRPHRTYERFYVLC